VTVAAVGTARSPAATEESGDHYLPIADHGLISDRQIGALIAKDGRVDWHCCSRLDSPSVFASLLDRHPGGHFQIHARKQCQHMR